MSQAARTRMDTTAAAICAAQRRALEDPRVLLIGESVGRLGGSHGTSKGLLEDFGPERVVDTPISDGGVLGLALGMAMGGKRPILELTGPDRLVAMAEELQVEVATLAARTRGEFSASLVIRVPVAPEWGQGSPESWLPPIEGLRVISPADVHDAGGMLLGAVAEPGPVVILEPQSLFAMRGEIATETADITSARCVREGADITVLAYGAGVGAALKAAESCLDEGIDAEVLNLRSLAPLDTETIGASVRKTGRVLSVSGGVSIGRVLACVVETAFLYLEAPPMNIASDEGTEAIADALLDCFQT